LEQQCSITDEEGAQIKTLEKKKKEAQTQLDNTKKNSRALENQVEEIQKKIQTIGGGRVENQRMKVETITKQIDELNSTISRCRVQVKSANKILKKSTQAVEEGTAQLEEIVKKLQALKTEKDSIDVEAEKVLNAYNEIEQLVENKTKELHSIEKEYNHSKKIVDEFESKKNRYSK